MAKIVIAELDIDINALLKSTSDLKKEIDALKNTQKDLATSGDKTSEAFVQNEAVLKSLNGAYNSNIKVIQESGKATQTQASQSELLSMALNTEVTSIAEARQQNQLLNKLRNETNVSTAEGKQQLETLNKKLDENNEFIKDNSDAYAKQKINIGNYSSALAGVDGVLSQFGINGQQARTVVSGFTSTISSAATDLANFSNSAIQSTASTLGFKTSAQLAAQTQATQTAATMAQSESNVALAGTTAATTTATAASTIGLRAFTIALASTGIGLIVIALGALVAYFKSSQEGIDALTSVTRPLQAIMSSLMGVLQNVGKYLFEAFNNPKKTLNELYEFVKTNLINRFTAFGKILEGIIELDFKKVTNGVLQAGTGVENMTDKIKNGAKETGKFLDAAIKKGQEIDRLKKDIERSELAFQRAQIKTNDAIDAQLLISKDTSRTFAERGVAANEIIRLTAELGKKEEEIIQKKIKALQLEYSMKDAKAITIAEQQKMIDLEKSLDDAQDRGLNARLEQTKVLSGLKKEQETAAKEAAAKEVERQNKAIELQLTKSKEEIELFKTKEGEKSKTAEQTYQYNKQIYDKENADLKLQFDKGKISKTQYETEKLKLSQTFALQNAETMMQFANAELTLFLQTNKTKLDNSKLLTDELIKEEERRLLEIEKMQLNILAKEKGVDVQKIEDKKLNNEQLTVAEMEYETGRIALAGATETTIKANKKTLVDQVKQQKIEQLAIDKELELANAQTKDEEAAIKAEQDYQTEMARLTKLLTDKKITQDQFDAFKKNTDDKKAELDTQREIAKVQATLKGMNDIAGAVGSLFGQSKELAIIQAGINGAMAITSILAQYPKFDGGFAMTAALVGAGASTVAQIAKIASAKSPSTPKFERGGIQEIGGKRHSAGGTKFFGEDGTRFEAEAGEGIGILNRNAFASFMDFNNAHSGGSSSGGFFAGGGIITQGVKPDSIDFNGIVEAMSLLPAPVVAVEEIQSVGNRYASVKSGADL